MLRQLVSDWMSKIPASALMAHVERLSVYDRYQASRGIQEASAYVAEVAQRMGLEDVSIEQFPADGKARWWSYKAPTSWTPLEARLEVRLGDQGILQVDHARQPMSLATYSAPTKPGGVVARLVTVRSWTPSPDLTDAIAVIPQPEGNWLRRVASSGAIGFVTTVENNKERSGRIELSPNASLFGFSLTPRDLALVQACAEQGAQARVTIEIDRSACMPVVTAVVPGAMAAEEIWVTAHLCHPRPGANDNASGVAAALGVAAAYRRNGSRPAHKSTRFVWGPEFTGVAAMLHACATRGRAFPSAVINLDMVGEDQSLCGGPFVVERSPDCVPSLINPLAEAVVREVFDSTGAVPGTWESAPFRGFSDHALFADRTFACPAVQFCHHPDRFNHSSQDSLDKVSADEMVRSAVSCAALAHLLTDNSALPRSARTRLVEDWRRGEAAATERIAERYRDVDGGRWAREFTEYVEARNRSLGDTGGRPARSRTAKEPILQARWEGPFNTRAMIEEMPPSTGTFLSDLVAEDKQTLALLFNFAIRIDGSRTRREILRETSFGLGHPIAEERAQHLFDAMIESLWVSEGPCG